jgi:GNAT superfamily N-acetyltransferase
MIHVDLRLAQRIERSAALHQADLAFTYAKLHPESVATTQTIGDGIATFTRADWPVNTVIGLGLANVGQSDQVDEVETFYAPLGVEPRIVICPFADRELLQQLGRRGYYIVQFMNVHVRRITPPDAHPAHGDGIVVTQTAPDQADEWALINVRSGRGEDDIPADDKWLALAQVAIRNTCVTGFIAWIGREPAGSAAVRVRDGVATLFSTSTHPRFRRRGVQAALLHARLAFAQRAGCDLAVVTTSPGSDSQRNVLRYDFDIGYTRITFARES